MKQKQGLGLQKAWKCLQFATFISGFDRKNTKRGGARKATKRQGVAGGADCVHVVGFRKKMLQK